jgi:hypothetical protein
MGQSPLDTDLADHPAALTRAVVIARIPIAAASRAL